MAFWHFYPSQLSVSSFWESTPLAFKQSSTRIHDGNPSVRKVHAGKLMDLFVCVCVWPSCLLKEFGKHFFLIPALLEEVLAAVLVSFCQTWLVFFSQPDKCAKSLPNTTAHSRGNTYILYIRMPRMHVLLGKKTFRTCLWIQVSFVCIHRLIRSWIAFWRFVWGAPVEV